MATLNEYLDKALKNVVLEMSDQQLEKIKKMWETKAKEKLTIEDIKGTVYAYGSELATLRLLKEYRENKKAKADYSINLKKFYFSLEM
jgi:hypothetical protein